MRELLHTSDLATFALLPANKMSRGAFYGMGDPCLSCDLAVRLGFLPSLCVVILSLYLSPISLSLFPASLSLDLLAP